MIAFTLRGKKIKMIIEGLVIDGNLDKKYLGLLLVLIKTKEDGQIDNRSSRLVVK